MIRSDEVIEELGTGDLRIIQKKKGFRFGTDAVILKDFAKGAVCSSMLDLCTGSGIIPILFSAENQCPEIHGIEIQPEIADMAKRSAELNRLDGRIKITCGDLREAERFYQKRYFDVITCNPPYIKAGAGAASNEGSRLIARHEIMCRLEDVIRVSAELLDQGGRLFMVHKPFRLADIFCLMRKYKIEPKRMKCVYSGDADNKISGPPSLVLVEGLYEGKSDLKVEEPVIL
ncbi:MAG: methyltransferase [Oscillospiraceae bacterium]|nr:methyltransferase [Oscillospiraceae bacterium]